MKPSCMDRIDISFFDHAPCPIFHFPDSRIMTARFTLLVSFSCLCILVNIACNKTGSNPGTGIANGDADLNRAYPGYDRFVIWPERECVLGVSLTLVTYGKYAVNGPLQLHWRILSGPGTPQIEIIDNSSVKLSGLNIGIYQYEVSFDAQYGTHNRDTSRVIVDALSNPPAEYIFSNRYWVPETRGFTDGSSITIEGIYNKIPADNAFRTFIKKANSTSWEELNSRYQGGFINGIIGSGIANSVLHIWSENKETGSADIKLVY